MTLNNLYIPEFQNTVIQLAAKDLNRFKDLITDFHSLSTNWPPYNIVKEEEYKWSIEFALAGIKKEDINITLKDKVLVVESKPMLDDEYKDSEKHYIHRGIAGRAFKKSFNLTEYTEVEGAEMKDGILTIRLVKNIPEEAKPTTIKIK